MDLKTIIILVLETRINFILRNINLVHQYFGTTNQSHLALFFRVSKMFFFRSYFYLSNLLSSLGKAWLDPKGFSELSRHLTCPASIEPMQRWSEVSAYTGASHHWTFILVDGSSPDVEMIKRKRCIELVQLIMHLGPHDWKMTSTWPTIWLVNPWGRVLFYF